MNKNPRRPKNMNKIVSAVLNPKPKRKTKMERYAEVQKEIHDLIFGDN
jgi:hypothetical protein